MKITEVKYAKRISLGICEHEELGVVALVEEGENHLDVIAACREDVIAALPVKGEEKIETVEPPVAPKKKKPAPKKEEPKEEEPVKDEPVVEDKPKKTRAKKEKAILYTRDGEGADKHKAAVVKLFDKFADGWKKDENLLTVCKDISLKMVGKPIFDNKGKLLKEFAEEVKTLIEEGKAEFDI